MAGGNLLTSSTSAATSQAALDTTWGQQAGGWLQGGDWGIAVISGSLNWELGGEGDARSDCGPIWRKRSCGLLPSG